MKLNWQLLGFSRLLNQIDKQTTHSSYLHKHENESAYWFSTALVGESPILKIVLTANATNSNAEILIFWGGAVGEGVWASDTGIVTLC